MRELTVGKIDAGQRRDRFLGKSLPLLPPALLQKYIRLKRIKVNGQRAARDQRLAQVDVLQLYDSYAQASSVLQVLRAIPNLGPCSTWEGLGVYGNLTLLTRNHEDAQLPLTHNIAARREEDPALFDTLELFLDNAGSIAKTSEELCIHRSTLY